MPFRLLTVLGILALITAGCGNGRPAALLPPPTPAASDEASDLHPAIAPSSTPTPQTVSSITTVASSHTASKDHSAMASVVNDVGAAGPEVALTFDDGPDNKYTPAILDILKKNNIKATFFEVGEHAKTYPQMIHRMVEEGHAVGNHSWDHADLAKMKEEDVRDEITKTDDVLQQITQQTTTLFRAPYGAVSPDVIADASATGHQIIGWSVDTMDWDGMSVKQIMTNVKKEVHPGAIILQHSAGGKKGNLKNTLDALPQIIAYLHKQGYSFVTVPELLAAQQTKTLALNR